MQENKGVEWAGQDRSFKNLPFCSKLPASRKASTTSRSGTSLPRSANSLTARSFLPKQSICSTTTLVKTFIQAPPTLKNHGAQLLTSHLINPALENYEESDRYCVETEEDVVAVHGIHSVGIQLQELLLCSGKKRQMVARSDLEDGLC